MLSETESKHFSNKIFEETGLVIGAKSIKNYHFILPGVPKQNRKILQLQLWILLQDMF